MSITTSPFKGPSALPALDQKISPSRTFVMLVVLIFVSELIAMAIISLLNISNYLLASIVDGLIMLLLISPGLYYLQVRPIYKHINDRKLAEEALLTNEDLLRRILEMLPVGVWITDEVGAIVYGNEAGQRIWAGARYVGIDQYGEYKAWWLDSGKLVEPDEWAAVRSIKYGEITQEEELEIECFDGTHKIILNSAAPIHKNNAIQGAIVVNHDITLRKKDEQELVHSHELIQKAFNSIDILIAYMDRDFTFIQVNEAYARSAGYPVEFFTGKNHFDLYPHQENQMIFQQVVDSGEPFSVLEKPFEYPEYPDRGTTYWNWRLEPVHGGDGSVQGIVLSLVDVTERKRAKLLLEQQNEDLQNLSIAERTQRGLAEGLVKSTLALNASLELGDVFKTILEQIQRSIPYHTGNILLLDNNRLNEVHRLDSPGSLHVNGSSIKNFPLDDSPLIQEMCLTHQPALIEDTSQLAQSVFVPGISLLSSYLAAPMVIGERVIGIISLTSDQPGDFNPELARRLMAFAAPAALAVENARLYTAEFHARQIAETLSAAAKALNQTLDIEPALDTLLTHLHAIVDSDTASVILLEDESRPTLRVARGYGEWANRLELPLLPLDEINDSIIHRLKMTRKSLTIPDLATDSTQADLSSLDQIDTWLIVPVLANETIIGLVVLGKTGSEVINLEHTHWVEALADQASVAVQNAWLFEQVRSSNERLKSLTHKLVEVQETERSYVARELHDEAGQILSSLKLSLGRLEQDPRCPPFVQERLRGLKSTTDSVLDEIHRLAMNLRPAALDHLGLVAALEQYTTKLISDQISLQIKVIGFENTRLPPDTETALYRIVQEALTNVLRHSRASSVGILLEWSKEGKVKLYIEDDGVGIAQDSDEIQGRIGLIGMRERAEMLGGCLTIESSPGKGTSIVVEVPDGYSYPDRR